MSVLAADRIGLTLGGNRVLDDVSYAFRRGRVTALLGPNGAGKSTLLSCLAALRVPDQGAASLDGVDVQAIERRARARAIGLLPQAADVHWDIDVATLVALGRLPHRGRWGATAADDAAVARALAATDMTALAGRGVERLSGGERGRALLARVLAGEPDWLLADEPLASLDPAHQIDVLDRLRSVAAAGGGVVLVLHDLHLAARIADDAVLMRGGRVVAAGPADDVLTAPLIAETYGVAVEIGVTPAGQRFILPIGR
ncbi:ABC transporter ATP-binding protein [Sphingomonas prati]|uniref:Iron complex transport system ATP-binding protein n=1 Tax=Sphingomonas prati TaxID=1843237 RepID=A0A7W9F087_9SPHN|nr:ABC transporter ATP-binding protein [Sphingomonas prati]MBB5728071.1 iron complex transport system ATP-binding protein [Sphingomonas prati]GGE83015.1 ABC transporter [Sphingomonas prati]